MEQKILNYSISLAFCLLLSLPLQAQNSDISAPPANTPPKKEKKEAASPAAFPKDAFYAEVELALSEQTGRRVKVAEKGDKGVLQIEFYGREDLQELANRLAPR